MPSDLVLPPTLEILDLSGNNLGGPFPVNSLDGLPNFKQMYLQYGTLTLPKTWVMPPTLVRFDVAGNKITAMGGVPTEWTWPPKIEFIKLQDNPLGAGGGGLAGLSRLPLTLRYIYLDNCQLSGACTTTCAL